MVAVSSGVVGVRVLGPARALSLRLGMARGSDIVVAVRGVVVVMQSKYSCHLGIV
jgi:hypothetical protein